MTTYYPFTPSATQPFQFQPTFDGNVYTVVVTWNVSGQRWYYNIYTLSGVRVVTQALISSPDNYDINLLGGYFKTSKMVFRASSQQFEVT